VSAALSALASEAGNDVIGSRSADNISRECFESALLASRSIRMQLGHHAGNRDPGQAVC
jgi:hypothetical protein